MIFHPRKYIFPPRRLRYRNVGRSLESMLVYLSTNIVAEPSFSSLRLLCIYLLPCSPFYYILDSLISLIPSILRANEIKPLTSAINLWVSINAISFPKQTLGPTPKRNIPCSNSTSLPSIQRSGLKASGSGPLFCVSGKDVEEKGTQRGKRRNQSKDLQQNWISLYNHSLTRNIRTTWHKISIDHLPLWRNDSRKPIRYAGV